MAVCKPQADLNFVHDLSYRRLGLEVPTEAYIDLQDHAIWSIARNQQASKASLILKVDADDGAVQ